MKHFTLLTATVATGFMGITGWAAPVDFTKQIKPILENSCLRCHGPEKPKGGLRLDTHEALLKGGDDGAAVVPGKPMESPLYKLTILPADSDDLMPPASKGGPLPKEQTDLLRQWIEEGARWPDGVTLAAMRKIDFAQDIQPILEFQCVACHQEGHSEGGLRLDTRENALKGGDNGPALVPGKSLASMMYTLTVLRPEHEFLMPPKTKGGPLSDAQTQMLRDWIDQGAVWPEGLTLKGRREVEIAAEDMQLLENIHAKIIAGTKEHQASEMKPYTESVPGLGIQFEMLAIPGGEFTMGTPEAEVRRNPDEGPQHKVAINPFWMGKTEVTWNEYEVFMYPMEERKIRVRAAGYDIKNEALSDAVARPTTPYVEMSFGMGKDGFPAISMTQYAARTYTKWLSSKTGHFYRLPTEAEWEYACRAGTTTTYSFGDDVSKLGEYAWYVKNSKFKYQKVATKKPNPWGLYDMHGNVAEWTLDQYDPVYYQQFRDAVANNPWNVPTKLYPRVARGGSWDDDPEKLRSGARLASNKAWKMQDPQLPKSLWYLTDAQFIGFRVVRPLEVPTAEGLATYWTPVLDRD